MKQYKEVVIKIRWVKEQDIVTESGGLWFGLFKKSTTGKAPDWGTEDWTDTWTEAK